MTVVPGECSWQRKKVGDWVSDPNRPMSRLRAPSAFRSPAAHVALGTEKAFVNSRRDGRARGEGRAGRHRSLLPPEGASPEAGRSQAA